MRAVRVLHWLSIEDLNLICIPSTYMTLNARKKKKKDQIYLSPSVFQSTLFLFALVSFPDWPSLSHLVNEGQLL